MLYRLCFLDRAGHTSRSRIIDFPSDDHAIDYAAALDPSDGLELWSGDLLLWRFASRWERSTGRSRKLVRGAE